MLEHCEPREKEPILDAGAPLARLRHAGLGFALLAAWLALLGALKLYGPWLVVYTLIAAAILTFFAQLRERRDRRPAREQMVLATAIRALIVFLVGYILAYLIA